ncbi:MAG: GNAT family N-acetyltransferase [Thermoleophilia bacterium]|nr:GNAT family N-acetyltransferase [Thermoleophilia bacterium]
MPRRLAAPSLADDQIRLEPLAQRDVEELLGVVDDAEIVRFTRLPTSGVDSAWVSGWIGRYEAGWEDGSRAGFSIRDHDRRLLGFGALVDLDLDRGEGEIGYLVGPAARGRGVARRAVDLLTRWSFDELGLERLELRIHPDNVGSVKVAERAGYRLDGVLRNVHFKEGVRSDLGVWSRLKTD